MSTVIHQDAYEIGYTNGDFIDLSCIKCAEDFAVSHTGKKPKTGEPFEDGGIFVTWHWPDGSCEQHKCECGALLDC